MSRQFNPAYGAALRAVEARQLQQNRAAACAGQKKASACRNPVPPARVPQGLSRHEGQHFPRLSAITLIQIGRLTMKTLRTSTNLRRCDARRLMSGGFEIAYIETRHCPDGDWSAIVWTRLYAPGEIRDEELPF
jgi:hypothetical protein